MLRLISIGFRKHKLAREFNKSEENDLLEEVVFCKYYSNNSFQEKQVQFYGNMEIAHSFVI